MNRLLAGGLSGLVATAPMTVAMELMHRELPAREQYPLPPREITEKASEEIGVDEKMSEEEHVFATLAAHFGYGAACGALYGITMGKLPGSAPARGIAFGLAVWSTSYLGLLPALGILKSAKDHPKRRNQLMIAAHVVWGATTGVLLEQLTHSNDATLRD